MCVKDKWRGRIVAKLRLVEKRVRRIFHVRKSVGRREDGNTDYTLSRREIEGQPVFLERRAGGGSPKTISRLIFKQILLGVDSSEIVFFFFKMVYVLET